MVDAHTVSSLPQVFRVIIRIGDHIVEASRSLYFVGTAEGVREAEQSFPTQEEFGKPQTPRG
jgi:hypothetical protein